MGSDSARRIRARLTAPSDGLDADLETLGAALPQDDPEAPTPPAAYAALTDIRRFYGRLARDIEEIRPSPPGKGDVLRGLRSLSAALGVLERGLRAGNTDEGQAGVAEGARRMQSAAAARARATVALT